MKKKFCFDREWKLSGLIKLLKVMKLTVFLFLVSVAGALASKSYSQTKILNLDMREATVKEVLKNIEEQSGFHFLYSENLINVERKVDVTIENKKIEQVLNLIFEGTDVDYSILDRFIVLSTPEDVLQQQKTVSGKVTDSSGTSLPGVTVVVKGTTKGTITDADGFYSLSNVPDDETLVFSFVGMKSQEIPVAKKTTINIIMAEETVGIEEVVAIGYGTVKRSDLTGSVSSVKGDLISSFSNTTVSQALQGRVAGVHVKQSSGHPGADMQIRIRGTNSIRGSNEPLWVIDGFPGNPNMINTSDIESMEVLKDASATAIYGSRGANGVIIITTKQAKAGKMQIEYNGSFSLQTLRKHLDLLNAKEYMQYMNIQEEDVTGSPYFTEEQINNAGEGTDWQDLVFQSAPIHDHSLNITGGDKNTQYSLGGSFFNQQGIVPNSGYQRITLRANLNQDISDKINLSSNILLSRSDQEKQLSQTFIGNINTIPPSLSPYNEDGTYNTLITEYPWLGGIQNPIAWMNERSSEWYSTRTMANLSLTYKPIDGLSIKISGNVYNNNSRQDNYVTTKYPTSTGSASISIDETVGLNSDNIITYNKLINEKHEITVMGGVTYEQYVSKSVGASGEGFLSDIPETYDIGSAITPGIASSGYSKWALLSYLTRLNYTYNDKYLATLSFRADGSSRYSKGNKWGYFPSGALAWRVSNEEFMKNVYFISNLKFRVGYGETGSTAIPPYSTLDLMSTGQTTFNKDLYTYFAPSSYYLSELKWETTAQTDIGIDAAFFNNRIRLTADYYIKNTRDLLNVVEMPRSSGYISSTMNVGEVQNKGLEFQLDANLIDKTFKWNVSSNISFNRNKVKKLANGDDVFGSRLNIVIIVDQLNLLREGEPIGVFYGYKEEGYDESGNIVHKDLYEDGVLNSLDKTIIGDPNPDFIYSFNSEMKYKNFIFSFYIQGSQGNDLYSLSMAALTHDYRDGINNLKEVLYDHWTEETPNAKYPALTSAATSSLRMSDRFVYDGSYLRLKNIELAYNIPTRKTTWIQKAQLYASCQNLLTITSYPWWDPDVNTEGGVDQGIDQNVYPVSKSFTCGVRINF